MLFASRIRRGALFFPLSMLAGAFLLSTCSMPAGRPQGAVATAAEPEEGGGGAGTSGGGGGGGKKARLCASRKQRIALPKKEQSARIGEFLKHQAGMEAILNTRALQSYHLLDHPPNTYRCKLPTVNLLMFEVAPVLDLRVTQTDNDCTVEMLSCKFEGSKAVEAQNDVFSACMRNYITWDEDDSDSEIFLNFDVNLNITLEINRRPFSFLPVSAVEKPGNMVMQGLVDSMIPQQVEQLLKDYNTWLDGPQEEHEHEHEQQEQELLETRT